jgi:SAM-dependent methyltransferase
MNMPNTAWENSFVRLYGARGAIAKNISRIKRGGLLKHITKNDLILDLFCGKCETGHGLRRLGFSRVVCGDYSAGLLRTATNAPVAKVCLDALNLPIKGGSFSCVIIQGGLHHLRGVDEITACLRAVENLLRPKGMVFISEPSDTLLLRLWLFFINKTVFWKVFAYARNWHAVHVEEKTTHEQYLKNITKVRDYLQNKWTIIQYKKGLVTDLFLLCRP